MPKWIAGDKPTCGDLSGRGRSFVRVADDSDRSESNSQNWNSGSTFFVNAKTNVVEGH